MAGKLSASRINCVIRCPREYVIKYHIGVKAAPSEALVIGDVFHRALDGKLDVTPLVEIDAEYPWQQYIQVMVDSYRSWASGIGGRTVAREVRLETASFVIVVDEVREWDNQWWILENKTGSNDDDTRCHRVSTQVLAYAGHATHIANHLLLDPQGFRGVMYTMTQKPKERKKKDESIDDFAARLTSKTTHVDFPVASLPQGLWSETYEYARYIVEGVDAMWRHAQNLDRIPANTAQCVRYGVRCPYWEVCHGENY